MNDIERLRCGSYTLYEFFGTLSRNRTVSSYFVPLMRFPESGGPISYFPINVRSNAIKGCSVGHFTLVLRYWVRGLFPDVSGEIVRQQPIAATYDAQDRGTTPNAAKTRGPTLKAAKNWFSSSTWFMNSLS